MGLEGMELMDTKNIKNNINKKILMFDIEEPPPKGALKGAGGGGTGVGSRDPSDTSLEDNPTINKYESGFVDGLSGGQGIIFSLGTEDNIVPVLDKLFSNKYYGPSHGAPGGNKESKNGYNATSSIKYGTSLYNKVAGAGGGAGGMCAYVERIDDALLTYETFDAEDGGRGGYPGGGGGGGGAGFYWTWPTPNKRIPAGDGGDGGDGVVVIEWW